jgi:uncharacterized delta-60 repeat protein
MQRRSLVVILVLALLHLVSIAPASAAPGDLDLTFDTDGKVTTDFASGSDDAWAVVMQSDGKIVTVGSADTGGTTGFDFALARYNADGSLDTTFDTDGKVTTDFANGGDEARGIAIQSDGKIVVAGQAQIGLANTDFALARYNANGSLDTTFDTDGKVTTDFKATESDGAYGVAIQSDGKIVAAGFMPVDATNLSDFALARYNANGSLDTTFDTDGKVTTHFGGAWHDLAFGVVIQSDGKIVAGGEANGGSGVSDFALARYNANGSLDSTFDTDGKVTTDFAGNIDAARGVAIQSDGKIVAAGIANMGGTSHDFALARYGTGGTLDTTFDTDGRVTTHFAIGADGAHGVAIQSDGKVVAAGQAETATGDFIDFALARYSTAGALDTTFSTDGKVTTDFAGDAEVGWGDFARSVAIQSDGKIVAAGTAEIATGRDFALARYDGDAVTPAISIDDVIVTEGNSGTTNATFTVTLSQASTQTVSVQATTADGSATAGSDYTATSGTVTFAPDDTSEPFTVPVIGDTDVESDETFAVNLSSPTNATIAEGQGTGTITNDDSPPPPPPPPTQCSDGIDNDGDGLVDLADPGCESSADDDETNLPAISIGDVSVTEGDSGTTLARFDLTLSSPSTVEVRGDADTADLTATAGLDYSPLDGLFGFAPGEVETSVSIAVIGDRFGELDETFLLQLSNAQNATIADDSGIATIIDDDEQCPGFESDPRPQIVGTDNSQQLVGTEQSEIICGLGGNDVIFGWGGHDLIDGGPGDDRLVGGFQSPNPNTGNDSLFGRGGADRLEGNDGADVLDGGPGADVIDAGTGADHAGGGAGADTINGGAGADELFGGGGRDSIDGGDGADTADGGSGNDVIAGGPGADILTGGSELESVLIEDADEISGGGGDDKLFGGPRADRLYGGRGDDELNGGSGADLLSSGEDKDTLDGGGGADVLDGGQGVDRLVGGNGDDIANGGDGTDVIFGGAGNDRLSGGSGPDVLKGGDGNDVLKGNEHEDHLFGNAGNDTLDGGFGRDECDGGPGQDSLTSCEE